MSIRSALGWATLLVLAQIILTAICSGAHSPVEGYFKLLNWDSDHYRRIARDGYSYPADGKVTSDDVHAGRANVVFFPGYPLAARALQEVTGLSIDTSLLVAAHASAVVMWVYFFLLLSQAGVNRARSLWAAAAVFAYPSSFFLVTGYTESLFLAASLGFIFWCDQWLDRKSPVSWVFALLHGWVLALTRIVGFAVAAYPVFRDGLQGKLRLKSLLLFGLSVLGSVAFFVYCQVKFGDWSVYFKLEEVGWQNHRHYFAIVNPLSYVPHFFFEHTVDSFSRSSVTFGALLSVAWAISEWRLFKISGSIPELRVARACVAFLMFYIALTGKAAANMDSMIRYTLPVYILLVLNFAQLEPAFFKGPRRKWKLAFALALGIGIGVWNMYRFTHGKWVA